MFTSADCLIGRRSGESRRLFVLPVLPIPPFEEFWVAFLGRSIGEVDGTAKSIEETWVLYAFSELIRHFIDDFGILSS